MADSHGRVQQPDEVMPLALALPEIMPAGVPDRELPVVLPAHAPGTALLTVGTVIVEVAPGERSVDGEGSSGDGTVIIGLTPPLSISVAPSGMVPPASDDPSAAPGVKSGGALPVDDTVAPELQPLEDIPPPSNVEPADVVDCVI